MSSESRDISYYSLVKIRDSSTPLGMTVRTLARELQSICAGPEFRIIEKRPRQLHDSRRDPSTYARDDAASAVSHLSRQRLLGVGKGVRGDGDNSGVFLQFARDDFVQRVGWSVMIIKIKAAVLHRTECRNAYFFHRLGIRADMLR